MRRNRDKGKAKKKKYQKFTQQEPTYRANQLSPVSFLSICVSKKPDWHLCQSIQDKPTLI